MSDAKAGDSGLASGLVNTTQQVGGALGLAVLATMSAARTGDLLAAGVSTASALTGGYRLAFAIGAGLVLTGLVLALTVLRRPGEQPEDESAQDTDAAVTTELATEPASA